METNAQPRTAATATTLKMTNPMITACQPGMWVNIQNGAARTSVPTTGTTATRIRSRIPMLPGSSGSVTGHGQLKGAFQPPKNSVTNSADTMKTVTYSAKKKNPK